MNPHPDSICILKLSAIGDVCHALPVVRTLQNCLPDTRLTWVIGAGEAGLLGDIPEVEFLVVDKHRGLGGIVDLRRRLKGRRFDVLLHMQYALRASAVSLAVNARRRIGFDRARARDGQWLFTNERIAAQPRQHVMEGLFGFAQALGVDERDLIWDIPLSDSDQRFAREHAPDEQPVLAISPCASNPSRNWRVARYAEMGDYAATRHGMRVLLTGGGSEAERAVADSIADAMRQPVHNLSGHTSLKQLVALFQRCRCLLTPDSGPAHLGTAAGIPVIGLYAVSNPERAGPYLSRNWVVNRYADNLKRYYDKTVEEVPWGMRIRHSEGMDAISVEEVKSHLDGVMACQALAAGDS